MVKPRMTIEDIFVLGLQDIIGTQIPSTYSSSFYNGQIMFVLGLEINKEPAQILLQKRPCSKYFTCHISGVPLFEKGNMIFQNRIKNNLLSFQKFYIKCTVKCFHANGAVSATKSWISTHTKETSQLLSNYQCFKMDEYGKIFWHS